MPYKDKDKRREAARLSMQLKRKIVADENISRTSSTAREGYIYLIQALYEPYYKIGMTVNNPIGRMKEMQTSCPHRLALLYVAQSHDINRDEESLHDMFWLYRKRGEWFFLSDEKAEEVIEQMMCIDEVYYSQREVGKIIKLCQERIA